MGIWGTLLDQIIAGTAPKPPMVDVLRLPPPDGWERGRVWGSWKVDPELFHAAGALFGGYLAALADSFVGFAMMTTLDDDEWFTTSDLRIAYFRPVTGGTMDWASEVLHRGRRQGHVEAVFVNDSDKIVAKATATQVIIPADWKSD
jgi:uncharacterized protein (TIGR00369 family)